MFSGVGTNPEEINEQQETQKGHSICWRPVIKWMHLPESNW